MKRLNRHLWLITEPTDFIGWEPIGTATLTSDGEEAFITLERTYPDGSITIRDCIVKPATLLPVVVLSFCLNDGGEDPGSGSVPRE